MMLNPALHRAASLERLRRTRPECTSKVCFFSISLVCTEKKNKKKTLISIDNLFIAGLVSYLIFQVAQPYSLETLVIPAVPSWAVWAFGAAAVATALFLPTTRLYGPLRFVYLECLQSIFPSAPSQSNWLLYPIFLLAFGPTMLSEAANKLGNTGGIALAVAAWVYTYRAYDAQLRAITEDVGRHTSVAKIALDTAREHAATTARYEGHLLGEGLMREDSAMASHAGAATAMQRGRLDKKDESATAPNQSDVSFEIALAAAETARLAEKAVSAARDGDMAGARQDAEAAKATANNTISLMEAVRQEMLKTRGQVRSSLKR